LISLLSLSSHATDISQMVGLSKKVKRVRKQKTKNKKAKQKEE
jgi:hypothetical protein